MGNNECGLLECEETPDQNPFRKHKSTTLKKQNSSNSKSINNNKNNELNKNGLTSNKYDQLGPHTTPQQKMFFNKIIYHNQENDPIEDELARIYLYKEAFIHKKQRYFQTRQQMQQHAILLCVLARAPQALQRIYHTGVERDLARCSVNNYKVELYADHLNYSLKQHLDYHRARGSHFQIKQIFYILREMCELALYLEKKKLAIRSFDPKDLYLDYQYCIKVPIAGVVSLSHTHHINMEATNSTTTNTIGNTMLNTYPARTIDSTGLSTTNIPYQSSNMRGSSIQNQMNSRTIKNSSQQYNVPFTSAPMTVSQKYYPVINNSDQQKFHTSSVIASNKFTQRVSSLYLAPEQISPVTSPLTFIHHSNHQKSHVFQEQTSNAEARQTDPSQNHSSTMSPVTRANASRVFSLGMLILQCITLLDGVVTYYDYSKQNIDYHHLNKQIKNIDNQIMAALVSRMLQVDPIKRITFRQLMATLEKLEPQLFQQSLLID